MKLKTTFIWFFTVFIFIGCGQPVVPSSQLTYVEVIEHKESASNSFEVSKMWLANTFNDSKSVIEYSSKENGTIIGKGFIKNVSYGTLVQMDTRFTLKIEVKDNKTRLTFQDMVQYPSVANQQPFGMWNTESLENFKLRAKDLVESYRLYISNKPSSNW